MPEGHDQSYRRNAHHPLFAPRGRNWILAMGFTLVIAGISAGCDILGVDVLHWAFGYNLYAISEGEAYRSRQPDEALIDHVQEAFGIRTVINLRGNNQGQTWYDTEARRLNELGIRLVDIPMSSENPPSAEVLGQLYEAFLSVDYPILIHCQAGSDRTGAAAAIWRMSVLGDPKEAALSELDCKYGHFREFTPAMDWLAEVFVPDADWIRTQYDPNGFYATQALAVTAN